jgi:hypothetical protein
MFEIDPQTIENTVKKANAINSISFLPRISLNLAYIIRKPKKSS